MSSMEEHFFSAGDILIKVGSHDAHDVRESFWRVDVKDRPSVAGL